jgi:hypothetical protein
MACCESHDIDPLLRDLVQPHLTTSVLPSSAETSELDIQHTYMVVSWTALPSIAVSVARGIATHPRIVSSVALLDCLWLPCPPQIARRQRQLYSLKVRVAERDSPS